MRKILVSDQTLKQLTNKNGTGLLFREKTAVASCADRIGADRTELPAITKVKGDSIIYKTISSLVKDSELAIPAGFSESSIDTAWECIRNAAKPCLQIVLPVATAQMEYSFRAKEKNMLDNITKLVGYAAEKCPNVEFIALDASRADRDFLIRACLAAQESGANSVTLCDDAGLALPEETAEAVKAVREACTTTLFVCPSDLNDMAVACAAAAIKAGADGVKTSMTGSGILLTEKFARLAQSRGESLGFYTALKTTELHRDIKNTLNNLKAPAIIKTEETDGTDIYLDAGSTLADVSKAAALLGYELSDEDHGKVYKALLQICGKKNSVGAKELEALIASNAMQVPSAYHLESYTANCSNISTSMAQVCLRGDNGIVSGVATGDGPIDSAFRAIEQSIGYHYELDAFEIQAVTEGKEALGSALVRLRNNGKLYSGNGLSTDIVGASIRAYINALNKIIFEENRK